jgi:DNA-binding CsgD family transcriptional regulator
MASKNPLEKKMERMLTLFEKQNKRIDDISKILEKMAKAEQLTGSRAKTEQFTEQNEQMLASNNISKITGRHREVLALLMNHGFHTYDQMAKKLNISQSRARAYIAELKNNFNVPLRQVRDAEGYKIGIDVRFVEQILALK